MTKAKEMDIQVKGSEQIDIGIDIVSFKTIDGTLAAGGVAAYGLLSPRS